MPHPLLLPSPPPLSPERIAYLNQRFEERMAAEKFLKEQKEREKLERKEEKRRQKERRRSSVRSGSVSFAEEGQAGDVGVWTGLRRESQVSRERELVGSEGVISPELANEAMGMRMESSTGGFGAEGTRKRLWGGLKREDGLFGALRRSSKGKEQRIV
jgi:hypothetical protein